MKRILYPVMAASFAALTACGGGGSSGSNDSGPNNPNPSSPSTPNPNVIASKLASSPQIIEYYGDSTIAGYESGTGNTVATTAVEAFKDALPVSQNHTVDPIIRNTRQTGNGVDGQTACMLLEQGIGGQNWQALMTSSNATVVILNHGINDGFATNRDNRVTIPRYRECLTQLAQIAQVNNKRVIFETPNPISSEGIADYAQAMREVAAQAGLPVIDQYAYLNQQYANRSIEEMAPDGFHPSQQVYIMKGQFAAQEFQKINK